jgi:hypothetical protein
LIKTIWRGLFLFTEKYRKWSFGSNGCLSGSCRSWRRNCIFKIHCTTGICIVYSNLTTSEFAKFESCQTWTAKFGQILLQTDARLVFCNRKLLRTEIIFTMPIKPICNFVNPATFLINCCYWPVLQTSVYSNSLLVCTAYSKRVTYAFWSIL